MNKLKYYLCFVILLFVFIGCQKKNQNQVINIKNYNTETLCGFMMCTAADAKEMENNNFTAANGNKTIAVYAAINCGNSIIPEKILKENNNYVLTILNKEAENPLACGADVEKVTINLSYPVDKDKLIINLHSESDSESEQLYPVNENLVNIINIAKNNPLN